jgi:hypothetical protein
MYPAPVVCHNCGGPAEHTHVTLELSDRARWIRRLFALNARKAYVACILNLPVDSPELYGHYAHRDH